MICHLNMGNNTGLIFDNSCLQSFSHTTVEKTQFQNKLLLPQKVWQYSSRAGSSYKGALSHECVQEELFSICTFLTDNEV